MRALVIFTLIFGWSGLASAEVEKNHAGHGSPSSINHAVDRPAWLDKLVAWADKNLKRPDSVFQHVRRALAQGSRR